MTVLKSCECGNDISVILSVSFQTNSSKLSCDDDVDNYLT